MLKDRVLTAVALLAGLLVAVFLLPPALWLLLCAALCGAAAWEVKIALVSAMPAAKALTRMLPLYAGSNCTSPATVGTPIALP